MAAVTSAVAAGVTAASAIGGAIKGARGTPSQSVTQKQSIGAKTDLQQNLERQSLQNFQRQQALAGQAEQQIGAADQLRDPAIQAYLQQISGEAFQATPQELQNIQNIRQAMVDLGTQDINRQLQQGITAATSGAAARGLRGQALGQLRGQVAEGALQQVGNISNQANLFAAQQAMSQPFQRVGAQQAALQQGLSYGDVLRQQAMQNRQMLQSPFLLQQEQQARLQQGTTTQNTPGQPGGFWGGVTGAAAGLGTGLATGANLINSYNDLRALTSKPKV